MIHTKARLINTYPWGRNTVRHLELPRSFGRGVPLCQPWVSDNWWVRASNKEAEKLPLCLRCEARAKMFDKAVRYG